MKKFFGIVLALIALTAVFAFGNEMAGLQGGLSAVGIGTYVLSYFAKEGFGSVALMGIGTIRPIKRGKSNLAGYIGFIVFTPDQFLPGVKWPVRGKGELTEIPLKEGEKGRLWTFNRGSMKGSYTTSGTVQNQTKKHLVNGTLAGWEQESLDSLDDTYNNPIVIVGIPYSGKRKVFGATWAPIVITDNGDSQSNTEDPGGPNLTVSGESEIAVDFAPRTLADSVVLVTEADAPYPGDEEGEEEPEG